MSIQFKHREETRVLMLHDSHTPPSVLRGVHVLRWAGRKLGLLEIGYHYVIDRDGHETETRPMALIGAASRRFNRTAIHICLVGGLDEAGVPEDNFTHEQRVALFDRIRILKGFYPGVSVMGHDEAERSLDHPCPPLDMADLRQDYAAYVATEGASEP
jgi:N-acetylmuramoyl-L-alanine amidase